MLGPEHKRKQTFELACDVAHQTKLEVNKSLGVILDSDLNFEARTAVFHLRNVAELKSSWMQRR